MITSPPRPASCRWPPTVAAVADLPHVPTPSRLISLLVVFPPSRSPVSYLRRWFAGLSRRPATPSYPDRFHPSSRPRPG